MTSVRCRACGMTEIESLGAVGLRPGSVTSDSLLSELPAVIWWCRTCDHLQKLANEAERETIDQIYASYQAHHLSGGREQLVFPAEGPPRPRSYYCLEQCSAALPPQGRLLDIGTGNGAVLTSAHELLPRWSLHGFDVGDRYRTQIEAMPGVEDFWSADFGDVPNGAFDLAVLWHTLEHVPEPAKLLVDIAQKLAPGGQILIQVPDVLRNPFDLAVIDHESHFGPAQLRHVCGRAGLRVALDGDSWVHNCLTLLLEPGEPPREPERTEEARNTFSNLREGLRAIATELGAEPFGIFGTGMAGLWMSGQFGRPPTYFIDEDEARRGQRSAGVPVIAPSEANPALPVVMSFMTNTALAIASRIATQYPGLAAATFVIAPETEGTALTYCAR